MPRKILYSGLGAVRLAARQPKASAAGVPRLPENRIKGSHCKGHRGINAQAGDLAVSFSDLWLSRQYIPFMSYTYANSG